MFLKKQWNKENLEETEVIQSRHVGVNTYGYCIHEDCWKSGELINVRTG